MAIIGIDEVGRGCWAGPLVAGAVLFEDNFAVPRKSDWKLADSKLLSKARRVSADAGIRALAPAYGLGWVENEELDALGMTAAVALAMRRALEAVLCMSSVWEAGRPSACLQADKIIIDGSFNYLSDIPDTQAIVKADGSVAAVSAASIIAKVARDNWMAMEAERRFPGYGFARHVGYGTREHQEALAALGVCDLHRRSFRPVAALC